MKFYTQLASLLPSMPHFEMPDSIENCTKYVRNLPRLPDLETMSGDDKTRSAGKLQLGVCLLLVSFVGRLIARYMSALEIRNQYLSEQIRMMVCNSRV